MKYLTDKQIAERFAVSLSTVWRWTRNGDFPQPIKLGPNITRWKLDEVEAWEVAREQGAA